MIMKTIDERTISALLNKAWSTPRKRLNFNLHPQGNDPVNRFVNAGFRGTYVRSHRHRIGKWELVTILKGSVDILIFTLDGKVEDRFRLSGNDVYVGEISGGDWHGLVFHAPAAVILEVKPGPYEPELDKEFAEWAPPEGDRETELFVGWLERAKPGDSWR
jgi:cupin fold WbuC family metalloprotein